MVVEAMMSEHLSHRETERRYQLPAKRAAAWERIYLEEGAEGLYVERRGRRCKCSTPKQLSKEVEEDLIGEVQRLRAEVAYLKKFNALVLKRVKQEKKPK